MIEKRPHQSWSKLDARDRDFHCREFARLGQAERDTKTQIAIARREIATSHKLMAEIDRILALK
jgi:hypothetical protein